MEAFGSNTFDAEAMKQKLPKPVFQSLQETIRRGSRLDPSIANEVAARGQGVGARARARRHFCHWFQPQTGLTAEKHDAFLTFDDEGMPMERFSGAQLIQSEPDASSFPRADAHDLRGARLHGLGPSSPIFIVDGPNGKTLCVPSVFISYHGDALDNKTPLLRSMEYLSEKALGVLRLFGRQESTRVVPDARARSRSTSSSTARFYALRPDLVACGRTLVGRQAAQGPGARGPLLRQHQGPHPGLHAGDGERALQARRPDQDAPQRGGAQPVRDGADLRGGQRRLRPQPDRSWRR